MFRLTRPIVDAMEKGKDPWAQWLAPGAINPGEPSVYEKPKGKAAAKTNASAFLDYQKAAPVAADTKELAAIEAAVNIDRRTFSICKVFIEGDDKTPRKEQMRLIVSGFQGPTRYKIQGDVVTDVVFKNMLVTLRNEFGLSSDQKTREAYQAILGIFGINTDNIDYYEDFLRKARSRLGTLLKEQSKGGESISPELIKNISETTKSINQMEQQRAIALASLKSGFKQENPVSWIKDGDKAYKNILNAQDLRRHLGQNYTVDVMHNITNVIVDLQIQMLNMVSCISDGIEPQFDEGQTINIKILFESLKDALRGLEPAPSVQAIKDISIGLIWDAVAKEYVRPPGQQTTILKSQPTVAVPLPLSAVVDGELSAPQVPTVAPSDNPPILGLASARPDLDRPLIPAE